MSSTEYSVEQREQLRDIAWRSIRHGLDEGRPLAVEPEDFAEPLRRQRACFVTLHRDAALRGCIGHLQAIQPLVVDVAKNAYAAAFGDPRFPALREDEYDQLQLEISVLSESEPVEFADQQDLLAQLRPGVDGLILSAPGNYRGTFLPSVWEQLPEPTRFLEHLKLKAGLPADYWSDEIQVERYTTESF